MSEISIPRVAAEPRAATEYFSVTDEALVVLTPAAIRLLLHLAEYTVVGDRADGTGLAGAAARGALDELETSGYATRLRVPRGRDPMFAVTPAGRREAARRESLPAGL
jgi:DNA-binding MarR family transcriptional regulator